MNPQELKTVHHAAGQIENALAAFEAILENTNNSSLYKSCGSLIETLRHLHEVDPTLLKAENRTRMQALIAKEKTRSGRDSFTTGF